MANAPRAASQCIAPPPRSAVHRASKAPLSAPQSAHDHADQIRARGKSGIPGLAAAVYWVNGLLLLGIMFGIFLLLVSHDYSGMWAGFCRALGWAIGQSLLLDLVRVDGVSSKARPD